MPVTKVIGFDPASVRNLGWSLVEIKESKKGQSFSCSPATAILPKVDEPWKALWPLSLIVDTIFSTNEPDLVIIEKTSSFAGGFVTGQVSHCMGVLLSICGKYNVPVAFVYPSHVKKVVTGNGRAKKSEVKKVVKSMTHQLVGEEVKFDSEHSCDAMANILCWLIESNLLQGHENG